MINPDQLNDLLLQALETEKGGVQIYRTAISCAVNGKFKDELQEYFEQTQRHVEIMTRVCTGFGLDPEQESPGREIVRGKAKGLLDSMEQAKKKGKPEAAELVAAEAVVDAETKDHANWELMAEVAKKLEGPPQQFLQDAVDEVEEEEDKHLYHMMGWCRELSLKALGLPAVLPPPEEEKDVDNMEDAAKAKEGRARMLSRAKKSGPGHSRSAH